MKYFSGMIEPLIGITLLLVVVNMVSNIDGISNDMPMIITIVFSFILGAMSNFNTPTY